MGVSWHDAPTVASLLGMKTVLNEFYAYLQLAAELGSGVTLQPRSIVIVTYALCGFANFSSIAIQLGGIGGHRALPASRPVPAGPAGHDRRNHRGVHDGHGRRDGPVSAGEPAVDIAAAAAALRARLGDRAMPEVAVVLGSGLGHARRGGGRPRGGPFTDVPGFPAAGVPDTPASTCAATWERRSVLIQAGRFHVYEGHPLDIVAAPVRVAAALGVRVLVLTNAAGGVDPALEPGDVVLLEDHLNLMFRSPLIGSTRAGEERFPDMSEPYDAALRQAALSAAAERRCAACARGLRGSHGPLVRDRGRGADAGPPGGRRRGHVHRAGGPRGPRARDCGAWRSPW